MAADPDLEHVREPHSAVSAAIDVHDCISLATVSQSSRRPRRTDVASGVVARPCITQISDEDAAAPDIRHPLAVGLESPVPRTDVGGKTDLADGGATVRVVQVRDPSGLALARSEYGRP